MSSVTQHGPVRFHGTQRYELRALLGNGSSGVLYEALDREQGVVVALKVLTQRSAESIAFFKNEFRALQGIRHPNLVELRELLCEEGHWLLSMQLVRGIDIVAFARGAEPRAVAEPISGGASAADETVRRARPTLGALPELRRGGRFCEARVRGGFRQLAEGVSALHAASMIHRDLKPSNVQVDAQGRVVVLDFGLVAALGQSGTFRAEFLLGTPRYMAPEQAALEQLGPASDWYSVGVMLYEALTGVSPFAARRPLEEVEASGARAIPPSERVPAVPRDLSELCMQLLSFDPAQRPNGAEIASRLAAGSSSAAQSSSRRSPATDGIFVGREGEFQRLWAAFARVRAGEPLRVVVEGESGVGKTALVGQFLEQARQAEPNLLCFVGRSFERESLPYKALDGVMDAVCEHLKSLASAELFAVLPSNASVIAQAFPALRQLEAFVVSERRLETTEPHVLRLSIFEALRELFANLCATRPTIIVMDDLQWTDIDSLTLLSALLRPPGAPQMLLIAMRRPGATAAAHPLPGAAQHLSLGPLSAAEATQLVTELLASGAGVLTSQDEVAALASGAQGHPLFLRELVRQLGSEGARGTVGRLEDALWRRIAQLDAPTRQLLELTSLTGKPLAQNTIAQALAMAIAEPSDDARVSSVDAAFVAMSERMAELRHACFIRTSGPHPNDTIELYHDRVRDAVLERLQRPERARYHFFLASALEHSPSADAEALAIHWQEAGNPSRARGHALLAAEQAAAALAFERAARLYRLSLELLPPEPALRQKLTRKLADALANAGHGLAAAEAYESAAEGSDSLESPQLRRLAAEQLLRSGYIERGIDSVSKVLRGLGVTTYENQLLCVISLTVQRARIRLGGFRFQQRAEHTVSPLELSRIDGTWTAATCLTLFDTLRSTELQCKNTLLALRAGTPLQVLRAHTAEALFLGLGGQGNRRRVNVMLTAAAALGEQMGNPEASAWVALSRGATAFFLGDWQEGQTYCSQAEAVFHRRAGALFELGSARAFRVWSSMMRGQFKEVLRLVPEYVDEAENRGDLYSATYQMTGFSNVAWLSQDDVPEARHRLAIAESRWPAASFNVPRYLNLMAAAHIELYDGTGRAAYERVLRDWASLRWGAAFRAQITRFGMRFARGLAALAAHDARPARGLLRDADGCARSIAREGVVWSRCFAEILRSGVALRLGNQARSLAHLKRAEAHALATGMELHRAVVRHRQGELIGGSTGLALMAEAHAFMASEEIKCPARMLDMLSPSVHQRWARRAG